MKSFDLAKAKAQGGQGLITRDGRPARIVCWDVKDEELPLVAVITNRTGQEHAVQCTLEGRVIRGKESSFDLFMSLTKHEGWVNVNRYYDGKVSTGWNVFATQEEANANASIDRVACVHIEWEE